MPGSILGDTVALQSRYSLAAKSGFTPTVASVGIVRSGEKEQSTVVQGKDGVRTDDNVTNLSNEDDVPLAALSRSLRLKSNKRKNFSICHGRGVQIQFLVVKKTRVFGFSLRKSCKICRGRGCLLLDPKRGCHRRQDQRYCERYFPDAVRSKDVRVLY